MLHWGADVEHPHLGQEPGEHCWAVACEEGGMSTADGVYAAYGGGPPMGDSFGDMHPGTPESTADPSVLPLTPPHPKWAAEEVVPRWADTPQRMTTDAVTSSPPDSPWDAVLRPPPQLNRGSGTRGSGPRNSIRIVHPTGAVVFFSPRWGSATVREARNAVAAEWCISPHSFHLHCSNVKNLSRSCHGTALPDHTPLLQVVGVGEDLYMMPLYPGDHIRDPSVHRDNCRARSLPERLLHAAHMLDVLAESPRECSNLQREMQRAVDLGRPDWCEPVLQALPEHYLDLLMHPCGNYLLRHCVENWPARVVPGIIRRVHGSAVLYACNRHASYVLQACLHYSPGTDGVELLLELLGAADHLASDSFGNYVLQSVIDECPPEYLQLADKTISSVLAGNCQHATRLRRKLMLRVRTRRRASERGETLGC
eukprot:TRINITY_DN55278_c0_g1_i1.p1 TRINITY_DN55278_c0_g1~~TRINITY_DN55278_c0_g1_i1.p1  ORF type:complete len:459 (+),score=135.98 TRINITY_DN55278_c0_g1_i1:103-1377(+)